VDKRGVIDSKTGKLIVCSKQVSKPETVRYLFKSPWFGALRNRSGIPVGPFKLKVEGNSNKSLDNSSFNVDRAWQLKAPYQAVKEHVPGFLWIEAENFAKYGGWILDTQFAHKMGSGYLLAPGVGVPVSDATTTVSVKKSGKYRIWARCKDWVPEHHPGRFTLKIDGKGIGREFGASGRADWTWEDGVYIDNTVVIRGGYRVTGPNGNSIRLVATGDYDTNYIIGSDSLGYDVAPVTNFIGDYWTSSSTDSNKAHSLHFEYSGDVSSIGMIESDKDKLCSIRAVFTE
jgi:hypothetical protein